VFAAPAATVLAQTGYFLRSLSCGGEGAAFTACDEGVAATISEE